MAGNSFDASSEFKVVADEFQELKRKYSDPVYVGAMLNRVSEERVSFNLVLKEINAKLDRLLELERRIALVESRFEKTGKQEASRFDAGRFLSEVDADMLKFVAQKGSCTAEEVQRKFNYRGANGASARLNNLFKTGLLDKRQAGKKVVFFPK